MGLYVLQVCGSSGNAESDSLTNMGRSKVIRKQIQGLEKQIRRHEDKIAHQLAQPYPDNRGIAKWRDDIARLRREITKLERKLPGGGR